MMLSTTDVQPPRDGDEDPTSLAILPFSNRRTTNGLLPLSERDGHTPELPFHDASGAESTTPVDTGPQNVPLPIPTTTPYGSYQSSLCGVSERSYDKASLENIEHISKPDIIHAPIEYPAVSVPLPTPAVTPYNCSQVSINSVSNSPEEKSSLEVLQRTTNGNPSLSSFGVNAASDLQQNATWNEMQNPSSNSPLPANGSSLPANAEIDHIRESPLPLLRQASRGATLPIHHLHPPEPEATTYRQSVEKLSKHLPHLKNMFGRERFHTVKLTCYDYRSSQVASDCLEFKLGSKIMTEDAFNQVLRSLKETPNGVNCRFIVAEDVSPELIELLGSAFGMNPEFFGEHLLNSGWRSGYYTDGGANSWNTRGLRKDYTSVRWYRPSLESFPGASSVNDRVKLLGPQSSKWTETVSIDQGTDDFTNLGTHHRALPLTNILRRDWNLKAESSQQSSTLGPVAWEERATVWSKSMQDCLYGMSILCSWLLGP